MKAKNPIWGSVGVLTGVIVAILALVRGKALLPLLIGTVSVWVLWLLCTQVLPFGKASGAGRQKRQVKQVNRAMTQTLLHHINYRVSDCLKAAYPDVRWEWMMRDPAAFVVQGGTGRIRLYGVPGHEYADVTVAQNGRLSCSFVDLTPVERSAERPQAPNRQEQDPRIWYDTHAREILTQLVTDLDSRGHSSLLVKEDGSVVISPKGDGDEVKQGSLPDLPAKTFWDELAELLERDGLEATVRDDCIAVTW